MSRAAGRISRVSLAVALLSLGAFGCGRAEPRLLVVGIDSANFTVIGPLLEQGRLPNLARIARRGASGKLRSFYPYESPRVWNTIATGHLPEDHGVESFFYHESGKRHLYLSVHRGVPALWNIASDRGHSVGVVNWWTTFPVERIDGVMVSDHLVSPKHDELGKVLRATPTERRGPLAYPEEWEEIARGLVDEGGLETDVADPFAGAAGLPPWPSLVPPEGGGPSYASRLYREDGVVARIALEIQRRIDPDLLMVLITGLDPVSHALWGVLSPPEPYPPELRPSDAERAAGKAALELYYEYSDALLGRLMSRVGRRDHVVVLSDHGMEPKFLMGSLTGGHATEASQDGILFAMGPKIRAGVSTEGVTVNDVMPTLLALMGLPIAEDLAGEPAPFLEEVPEERIASFTETTPIERLGGDSGVEDEMIEELRALGYGE